MVAKTKECQSYTINTLRKASADLDEVESMIREQIIAAAKNLLEGGYIDPSVFAGNFRVYEMITDRFESAKDGYMRHQERCVCDIPDDIDAIF